MHSARQGSMLRPLQSTNVCWRLNANAHVCNARKRRSACAEAVAALSRLSLVAIALAVASNKICRGKALAYVTICKPESYPALRVRSLQIPPPQRALSRGRNRKWHL